MLRTRWLQAVLFLIGCGVLAGLLAHFGIDQILAALRRADTAQLAVYLGLAAALRVLLAARWAMIARLVGPSLPLGRLLTARLAGDALSSLVPAGRVSGDPLRVILIRRLGVPGVEASAGVALDRFLEVTGNTITALIYIAIYSATQTLPHAGGIVVLLLFLLAVLAGTGWLLRNGYRPFSAPLRSLESRSPRLRGAIQAVRLTEDSIRDFLQRRPRVFTAGVAMSLMFEALTLLEYHFLLSAFGLPANLSTLILVLLGGGLSRAVPTPAGIGAFEATQVVVLGLALGQPEIGLVVGIILRLDDVLWTLIGLAALAPNRSRIAAVEAAAALTAGASLEKLQPPPS